MIEEDDVVRRIEEWRAPRLRSVIVLPERKPARWRTARDLAIVFAFAALMGLVTRWLS